MMNMKSDNVADYLQNNPEFFNEHAELLADIVLPHPHGGRTISLSERQLLVMREKVKVLERQLHEWMAVARENEALQDKLHQYTLALLACESPSLAREVAVQSLKEIFSVPHAVLHLWQEEPPSAEVLAFAEQHAKPACAHHPVHDTATWFGEQAHLLQSFAYLPLRDQGQTTGMLVLASEDAHRFYPEMGTAFLQRIAEMVSQVARVTR